MASVDVVLDCGSLTAPLAGIGCYAANLLAALRSSDEIGSLRCFNGRDVRPVDELFSQPSSAASQWWPSAGPARFLKRVLRERQVAYEVRHWLRDRRFMHGVKGLEDQAGMELFVRRSKPMRLSAAGIRMLRAADIMSMNRISIDIGPTRHGITRGTTIYAFDPSGNRFETFCGGYDTYPDYKAVTRTWDEVGAGIFYHDRKLNERFLSVVS